MLSKKKKVFILAGMVSLLVLVVCLNIFLNQSTQKANAGTGSGTGNFFIDSRQERETTRDQLLLTYDAIIANANSSEETKKTAEASKLQLLANIEVERIIETQIKALGFEDVYVTISPEKVNVIVKTDELTSQETAQILNVVKTETGKAAKNVGITPV